MFPYSITSDSLHFVDNLRLLVGREDVGDVARVEDHTDVLHEGLIFDLVVGKQEHRLLTLSPGLFQQLYTVERRQHVETEKVNMQQVCKHPGPKSRVWLP